MGKLISSVTGTAPQVGDSIHTKQAATLRKVELVGAPEGICQSLELTDNLSQMAVRPPNEVGQK